MENRKCAITLTLLLFSRNEFFFAKSYLLQVLCKKIEQNHNGYFIIDRKENDCSANCGKNGIKKDSPNKFDKVTASN